MGDTAPAKVKQLLVIYGKVAKLNPQHRQIISCCVYVFPSNSDFTACFPMWQALKEKRGTCAREPSEFIGSRLCLPGRSSLATWGTEARVCSLTHPTFSITVLANHLCPCIYKPPLQIQWAWLVPANGLWKKQWYMSILLRQFTASVSPASGPCCISLGGWKPPLLTPRNFFLHKAIILDFVAASSMKHLD